MFSLSNISAVVTSGTVTTDGAYTIVTFTSNGYFNTTEDIEDAEILVIGGGGAGGGSTSSSGGGGGAGGVLHLTNYDINSGNYVITIGAGGSGNIDNDGDSGSNSSFNNLIGVGGAGGVMDGNKNGINGGSGGGSSGNGNGGLSTQISMGGGTVYAHDGGTGDSFNGDASGGGGAGEDGEGSTSSTGGAGGNGYSFDISGTATYYAGGGGGGSYGGTPGAGGTGGGGSGGVNGNDGTSATANTGSGGGGSGGSSSHKGGDGGSGIVIIRYSMSVPGLSVVLNSPSNNTTFNYPTVTFNTTVTDNFIVQNVSLLIDGSIDQTDTTHTNGTYILSKSLTTGEHNWSILAFDNDSNYIQSETRTLEITIIPPTIELSFPPNNYVTSNPTNEFFALVYDNFEIENVSIYFDGSLYETDTSVLNNTNLSFVRTLTEGSHTWYIEAYDNDSFSSTSATRTIKIKTTPPTISISAPKSVYKFLNEGDTLNLNFTVTDPNLDTCISEYNGVNTTRACSSGVEFKTTFPYHFGAEEIRVYANDTAGNVGVSTKTWDIQLSEISRTFNSNVVQTAQELFVYSGGTGDGVSVVSGKLWYNGTSYSPVVTKSGDLFNITNNLEIPTTGDGLVSFYWEIVYQNSTGTFSFNTTSSNQTIYDLVLYECSGTNPNGLTLNFTTYDSTNLTLLNTSLEATFQFYAVGGTGDTIVEYLFSDLNENRSNYMYCLNSSNQNITLNAFISYTATGYDRREYIISDGVIGNFTQTIPLYLTQTSLTDIVTIIVQDQNYDAIQGALVSIQRWNVGTNTYSTIGMLTTSSEGKGIIDLELYTTWYRAVVYSDGEIIKTTDVQKLDSTTWDITIETETTNPYDLFGTVSHGLTFDNSTNITSFTWFDSSGYVGEGCLVVKNQTSLGDIVLFNSCVSSVSGTIDYQLTSDGTYLIYGIVFLQGYNQSQIIDFKTVRIGTPTIIEKVSPYGKVISMLLIGTSGLIGVTSGSAILGMFLIIITLILLVYLGFLNVTSGFIWGMISIGLIIVFMQRRKN